MSRKAAAVIGLSCSDKVNNDVQPEKISDGTDVSLQCISNASTCLLGLQHKTHFGILEGSKAGLHVAWQNCV